MGALFNFVIIFIIFTLFLLGTLISINQIEFLASCSTCEMEFLGLLLARIAFMHLLCKRIRLQFLTQCAAFLMLRLLTWNILLLGHDVYCCSLVARRLLDVTNVKGLHLLVNFLLLLARLWMMFFLPLVFNYIYYYFIQFFH